MISQGLVGAILLASVMGLFFLCKKIQKQTSTFFSKKIHKEIVCSLMTSDNHGDQGLDIIIVGAGVAGSALAYTLGKDGRRVKVIERDLSEPDRIVGEILQQKGYQKLMDLGLEDCVEEIDAQQFLGYALFKDGKSIKLSYSSDVPGRSFHNGRFIQRMRRKASALPNVKLEQGTVTSLITEKETVKGVQYKTKNGERLIAKAPLTIVCDGCFSNLRRFLCNSKVDIPSCMVALILENCKLPYANHGHNILADPSVVVFYSISSTEIRCMVDVPGQKVPSISNGEMSHFLKTVVAPQIPAELYNAFISAIDHGNIRTMPVKTMLAAPYPTPGALLLGDALNMRHSATGGGMTVALSDIVVLRDLLRPLRNLNDASALCNYLESFYTLRQPTASTINIMADVTYKVFRGTSDPVSREMRQLCFDYLSLAGVFSEPMALLSGARPLILILHCFAMVLYFAGRVLLPFPSFKRLLLGAKLIWHASSILFPILKAEGVTQVFSQFMLARRRNLC